MLHHKLYSQTILKGELVLKSGFHLGSPVARGITNAAINRDSLGRPFIPGASLKGCLRARLEGLAHTFKATPAVCFLKRNHKRLMEPGTDEVCTQPEACLTQYRDGARFLQVMATQQEPVDLETLLPGWLCPVCRLLGAPSWRGKVAISDLYPIGRVSPSAEIRDGVGLDRDLKTAVSGVKYTFEALPSEIRFSFYAVTQNLDEHSDWPLLAAGLSDLREGLVSIGGKKTRGLGRVVLEKLCRQDTNFTNPTTFQNFFGGHDAPWQQVESADLNQIIQHINRKEP